MWVESRTENLQQILALVGDGQVPTGEANVDGSSGRCPEPDSDADADAGMNQKPDHAQMPSKACM